MGKNSLRKNVGVMIRKFVEESLAQDVGRGDLYALVEPSIDARAEIIAKSNGVLAGVEYVNVLAKLEGFEVIWAKKDSDEFVAGEVLVTLRGGSHTLLRVERTVLNMLLHASSIATLTKQYVEIVEPYGVKLLDTRKTRPLLRVFEKYATRCGGAVNHRMGLDDALMLKDTHLKTIENLKEYIEKARKKIPFTAKIEVEAETLEVACEAMEAGSDIVMCDNMTLNQIFEVVSFRDKNFPHILLEASGNISLDSIESYAKRGIDAISSGSLIHQANWIDLSMKMR
ncbi:MAG: nicotinate-nucleotide pyrophosphorylase (carboxylating) [Sulfurimonas sp.]|jgi:nicotinate-nucleotide pyrophosphorylase (carboxylating)